jgi:D-threo-aldose 1-dehydrogenase
MKAGETRPLGKTNLRVSQMGFGGAPFGNLFSKVTDEDAEATIEAALAAGIRYFDTAPLYGHGLSEHRIGAALRDVPRDSFVLSTKIGRLLRPVRDGKVDGGHFIEPLPFEVVYDYGYDATLRSVEDSLQRLGMSRIDILLIHDVDVWTHGTEAASRRRIDEVMAGGYRAMRGLREQGVVGAIGAGLNEWEVCQALAERGEFDCFLLAGRYTLLEQEALASFLPLCERRGISVIIGGPYNTGILARGDVPGVTYNYRPAPPEVLERVARIEAVCKRHGVALAEAAIQFPLRHPAVAAVIPGARAPYEIERNVAALAAPIPDALWADLRAEGLLRA